MTELHERRTRWEGQQDRARQRLADAQVALAQVQRDRYPGGRDTDPSTAVTSELEQARFELRRTLYRGAALDFLLDVAGWELDAGCEQVQRARRIRRAHGGHWPWADEPRAVVHRCAEHRSAQDLDLPCEVLCVDDPLGALRRIRPKQR